MTERKNISIAIGLSVFFVSKKSLLSNLVWQVFLLNSCLPKRTLVRSPESNGEILHGYLKTSLKDE